MKKKRANYCFPNALAEIMSKIDIRTQYESTMMSVVMILSGMTFSGFYSIFFMEMSTFYKVMIIFNIIGAFIFLSSSLVTTYQQYTNYMETLEIEVPDYGIPK